MLFSQLPVLGFACYLSFFPLRILSLTLTNLPHILTDVNPASVNIEWLETPGDPPFVDIQIRCGTVSILQPPISAKTSVHGYFINHEEWNGNTFRGTCNIQAFDGQTLLDEGPSFSAPILPVNENPAPPRPSPQPTIITLVLPRPTPIINAAPAPTPITTSTTHSSTVVVKTSVTSRSSSVQTALSTTTSRESSLGVTTSAVSTAKSSAHVTSTTSGGSAGLSSAITLVPKPAASGSVPTGVGGLTSHKKALAAIIGGVIGGIVFLVLVLVLLWLYVRRRRYRKNFVRMEDPQSTVDISEGTRTHSVVSSFFTRRDLLSTTPDPMIPDDDHSQPEDQFGRFRQLQQEMHEAQRQRDLLGLNLNNRNSTIDDTADATFASQIEQELRRQYDHLGALVLELEAQLEEIELPPDYASNGHF